jgi:hypothetical protein
MDGLKVCVKTRCPDFQLDKVIPVSNSEKSFLASLNDRIKETQVNSDELIFATFIIARGLRHFISLSRLKN